MKVKNAIKKVGAVAGSALMVGMTMGAAQSLSEFPQPFVADDGTVESQVVVGANAKTADVVGAINVAAALGQNTVQTETREVTAGGTTETTVEGLEAEEGIGDATPEMQDADTGMAVASGNWWSASDVPQLFRGTIEYDDTDYFVNEQVSVDGVGGVDVAQNGTSTTLQTSVDSAALQHRTSFTPALPNGSTFEMAGVEYQFIEWDGTENTAVLGETESATGLSTGDSVEFGPYTVTVGSPNLDGNAVQITVREDGTQIDSFALSDGETETSDDGNLEVTGEAVFVSIDQEVDVNLDLTWRNTEMTAGEDAPFDDQYTVQNIDMASTGAPDEINSITLENQYATGDEDGEHDDDLEEGETYDGPNDQYGLTFTGISDATMDSVEFERNGQVTYTDSNQMEHTVDLTETFLAEASDYTTVSNADGATVPVLDLPVEVASASADTADTDGELDLTIEYQQYDESREIDVADLDAGGTDYYVSEDFDTGYGSPFHVVVEVTATSGSGNTDQVSSIDGLAFVNASASGAAGTAVDANPIGTDQGAGQIGVVNPAIFTGLQTTITDDGISLETSGGSGPGTVDAGDAVLATGPAAGDHPVAAIYDGSRFDGDDAVAVDPGGDNHQLEEGDSYLTDGGSVVEYASTSSVQVDFADEQRLAEFALGAYEETTTGGETVEYEAAVGQGAVPDMAMLDSEVTDQTKSNNHLILVGGPAVNQLVADLATAGDTWTQDEWQNQHDGEALLQVVEDAFVQDRHALIVAGHSAEDTRVAAEYISNYADNADELAAAGNQQVLTSANFLN